MELCRKHQNSHVGRLCAGYKIPQTIIEEEGHRIETPSRGSEWYYREGAKTWEAVDFFFLPPHSSAWRLPESQQWSPDGAAKAGLIHVLLVQAGGWRNEEVEGHSHRDNHHNSGVSCAAKWLMAAINVAQEKRGYYICCGGEWCFALYKLEVQGNNSPYSLMEKPALETALAAFVSWSSKWMELALDGWNVAGSISKVENVY